jgi:hypothetical protein
VYRPHPPDGSKAAVRVRGFDDTTFSGFPVRRVPVLVTPPWAITDESLGEGGRILFEGCRMADLTRKTRKSCCGFIGVVGPQVIRGAAAAVKGDPRQIEDAWTTGKRAFAFNAGLLRRNGARRIHSLKLVDWTTGHSPLGLFSVPMAFGLSRWARSGRLETGGILRPPRPSVEQLTVCLAGMQENPAKTAMSELPRD